MLDVPRAAAHLRAAALLTSAALLAPACGDDDPAAPARHACAGAATACDGTLRVPERWSDPGGPQIEVAFRWLPRRDPSQPSRGAIFGAIGGPGAGLELAPAWELVLGDLREGRDLLLMDYRGFGRSTPLACDGLTFDDRPGALDAAAACAAGLGARATSFSTASAAEDLRAILDALELDRIDLVGESYGTLFGQAFAARHPERVRTLVLDSTVPPTGLRSDDYLRVPLRYLPELCARSPGCAAPRDPAALRATLVSALELARGGTTPVAPAELGAALRPFSDLAIARDVAASLAAYVAGDAAPIQRLARDVAAWGDALVADSPGGDGLEGDEAALFAYNCGHDEWLPYARSASRAEKEAAAAAWRATPERYAPFTEPEWTGLPGPGLELAQLCAAWPAPAPLVPPVPPDAPTPDVPTLLIAGTADETTPVEDARALAARLPRAALLEVPLGDHWVALSPSSPPCAREAMQAFIASGELPAPGGAPCVARQAPAVDRLPRTVAAVTPFAAAGVTAAEARLLRGAVLTALDAALRRMDGNDVYLLLDETTGMRGGRARFAEGAGGEVRIALEGYRWLEDLAVTGELVRAEDGAVTGTLAVAGPGGAAVSVALAFDPLEELEGAEVAVSATLAGRAVAVRIPVWAAP